MKLDVFNHILPKAYFERLVDIIPDKRMLARYPKLPTLWDIDAHLDMMDGFGDYVINDVEPEFSGARNLVTVAMVEAMGVASDQGRIIDFEDYLEGDQRK